MIRAVGFALLLLFAAEVPLDGQRRGRSSEPDEGPVQALLEMRVQLGLSDEQVTRLTAIDAEMRRRNEPFVTRLVEVRRAIRALGPRREFTPEQRATYDQYISQARPLMKQIRENNHAAMRQVGEVLSEAQKAQVSDILRSRKERDGDRRRDRSDSSTPARRSG